MMVPASYPLVSEPHFGTKAKASPPLSTAAHNVAEAQDALFTPLPRPWLAVQDVPPLVEV